MVVQKGMETGAKNISLNNQILSTYLNKLFLKTPIISNVSLLLSYIISSSILRLGTKASHPFIVIMSLLDIILLVLVLLFIYHRLALDLYQV